MNSSTGRQAARGFTLLELIIVMGIAGILLMMAIPSYRYVTSSNRVAGEINGLLGDLQFARAEAIKEGLPVTVCIIQGNVSTGCGNVAGTPWHQGWIVFSDANNSQKVDAPTDVVLRVQNSFTGSDTLTANNQITAITFNREGFATANGTTLTGNNTLLTLHTSPLSNNATRCLSISTIGSMAVQPYGGNCL